MSCEDEYGKIFFSCRLQNASRHAFLWLGVYISLEFLQRLAGKKRSSSLYIYKRVARSSNARVSTICRRLVGEVQGRDHDLKNPRSNKKRFC